MKHNVLEMLLDLFDDFETGVDRLPFDAATLQKLEKLGFDQEAIEEAYAWFHDSAPVEEIMDVVSEASPQAFRAYHIAEIDNLPAECRGLLMKLEQMGLLTTAMREQMIAQMLQLDLRELDSDQLKWLNIILLSDYLDDTTITQVLDHLLLQTEEGRLLELN